MGHGHEHPGPAAGGGPVRPLAIALALIAGYAVVELVGGLVGGSLALLADAGHMASDAAALALAITAVRLGRRPATSRYSYGFRRGEILAALVNGAALVAISAWIVVEAVGRLSDPPEVDGAVTLAVAAVGLAVNVAAALVLIRGDRESLNLRAALLHVVGDALGSVGVVVSSLLILGLGSAWLIADPIVGILIGLLVAASAWRVLRESADVLLEGAPRGLDVDAVGRAMAGAPGVVQVHDLHVWTITSGFPALSAHVLVEPSADCHAVRRRLAEALEREHGIAHSTLQVEHAAGRLIAPPRVTRQTT
jgi:cobalt-zinc-cadmium efflux system protein